MLSLLLDIIKHIWDTFRLFAVRGISQLPRFSDRRTQFRRRFVYNIMLTGIIPSSPLPFARIGYIYHGAVHAIHKLTQRAPKQ